VARQFVERFFPADYQLIPNGIDLERFHPQVPALPELLDDKQNILFVGRFDRRKGARYLVQAIPQIRAHYPQTRFLFVGDGHLRPDLQRYVQRQGWPDVLFPGYVSPDILPRYFASAQVFCSPATGGESMGIVLLEAMASGVPVAATTIPGYTTVVEHGHDGLLTIPGRSDDLARGIVALLADQELRQQFRRQGLAKIQHYAWPSVARRIVAYYHALLETQDGHAYERMSV
jgi:phosphatidylinositol alpha-mannosyltransferase